MICDWGELRAETCAGAAGMSLTEARRRGEGVLRAASFAMRRLRLVIFDRMTGFAGVSGGGVAGGGRWFWCVADGGRLGELRAGACAMLGLRLDFESGTQEGRNVWRVVACGRERWLWSLAGEEGMQF